MRFFASLLLGAGLLSASGSARAYCRTTTEQVPPDYNPEVSGCLTGTALAWPAMPVAYQVYQGASTQVSLQQATSIVDESFAKWPAVTCSNGDHPALSVTDVGPTSTPDPLLHCDASPCTLSRDAVPGIYFRDDAWPYDDQSNEIALTTVTYGVDDGHIFAAVMEINSHDHVFSTTVTTDPSVLSLEAVVTHEAGHFVGMAHSQTPGAVMDAFYQGDAVTLTSDDIAGICEAYPPAKPSSGCAVGDVSASGGLGGALLAAVTVVSGLARRRRTTSLASAR